MKEVIAHARRNRYEGVGCSEAPRGTLFHHYKVKGGGLLKRIYDRASESPPQQGSGRRPPGRTLEPPRTQVSAPGA